MDRHIKGYKRHVAMEKLLSKPANPSSFLVVNEKATDVQEGTDFRQMNALETAALASDVLPEEPFDEPGLDEVLRESEPPKSDLVTISISPALLQQLMAGQGDSGMLNNSKSKELLLARPVPTPERLIKPSATPKQVQATATSRGLSSTIDRESFPVYATVPSFSQAGTLSTPKPFLAADGQHEVPSATSTPRLPPSPLRLSPRRSSRSTNEGHHSPATVNLLEQILGNEPEVPFSPSPNKEDAETQTPAEPEPKRPRVQEAPEGLLIVLNSIDRSLQDGFCKMTSAYDSQTRVNKMLERKIDSQNDMLSKIHRSIDKLTEQIKLDRRSRDKENEKPVPNIRSVVRKRDDRS